MTDKENRDHKKELRDMDKFIKKVSSNKEQAVSFLKGAGILDAQGKLAKNYR
jgi:hypothetical protein